MRVYTIKMLFVLVALSLSTFLGTMFSNLKFGNSIYFAAFFQFSVFMLVRYFIHKSDLNNPNSQIRRIMIGSTLRMLVILIFLVITMLNQVKVNLPWTLLYCLYFLLFLLFDISEKHSNLRPDLKIPNENGNS